MVLLGLLLVVFALSLSASPSGSDVDASTRPSASVDLPGGPGASEPAVVHTSRVASGSSTWLVRVLPVLLAVLVLAVPLHWANAVGARPRRRQRGQWRLLAFQVRLFRSPPALHVL